MEGPPAPTIRLRPLVSFEATVTPRCPWLDDPTVGTIAPTMSAGRKALILGLGIGLANVAGITISVLNGVDVFVAITAAALATLGVTVMMDVASLITARQPAWGHPKPHARLWALSSLAMSCSMAITTATLLVPGTRPRPVLGVLIVTVAMPLIGVSLVLSRRATRLRAADQV